MSDITLYFAQHGLAVDKADDPERPLSDIGKKQTKSIASVLRENEVPVSLIFHSGKLRAAQTAEIFTKELQQDSITVVNYLSPNDDIKLTAKHLTTDNALYIGHLPHLEKLVAYLVTDDENNNIIKFRNSAVACLQKVDDNYQLHWYLTPELTEK